MVCVCYLDGGSSPEGHHQREKLIILSAKERHPHHRRVRFFFGGMFLSAVSLFTLFVSTIYNEAIATSNTEIIANSVIILFITDLDELFYCVMMTINPRWTEKERTSGQGARLNKGDEDSLVLLTAQNLKLQDKVQRVENEMEELRGKMMRMEKQMGLGETPAAAQDNDANDASLSRSGLFLD